MKTVLKILGGLLVLIVAALILIPIIFKDDLVQLVKDESNNAVNAQIDFGDFSLSLIKSFPDFYFSIEEVSVVGINEFEGVELAYIKELDLTVDLMSVINGESIQVKNIEIIEPRVYAKLLPDGAANYDIAKESETEEVEEEVSEEASSFKLDLAKVIIRQGQIRYEDPSMPIDMLIKGLDLDLSGDLTESITNIEATGAVSSFNLIFDGIKYMNEVQVKLNAAMEADIDNFKFTFKENEVWVNQLPLAFDGWVAMPNDPIDMDFTFEAKKSDFIELLSLIPAEFAKELEGVETSGMFALNGYAKGTFIDSTYPAFGLNMKVENARFNYPDLPKSVEDIQIQASVESKDGVIDHTIVDVSQFHLSLADNPFDLQFYLATPISDPFIRAAFAGKIVLDNIKDVVPLEKGDELAGTITSNIKVEGNVSTLEKGNYEEFKASGDLQLANLHYATDSLDYPVDINKAMMKFSPRFVELSEMEMTLGKSDLAAQGRLENFIAYALKDNQTLKGTLNVQSKLLDINELAGIDPSETTEEESSSESEEAETEEPMEAVLLPRYIDFTTQANITQLIFDNMEIKNIEGAIVLRDERISMTKANMDLLGGSMNMTGFYDTKDSTKPAYDFDMKIKSFDVKQTVNTFNTVKTMVPIAEKSEGAYSASMKIRGDLTAQMDPIYESMFGSGTMNTEGILIRDYEPLVKIGKAIKYEKLNPMDLKDIDISFTVTEGKIFVNPFEYKVGETKVTIAGSNSFDQTIDYIFSFAIPRSEFGSTANAAVDGLLAQAAGKGIDIKLSDVINIDVRMTGKATDPKISTDFKKSKSNATDAVKDRAKEELEKKKKELEDKAKQELEKKKAEAEEEAKRLLEEQKKKAEEELKKKQEEAKKKLEEEAKKKLKGLFK